MKNKKTTKKAVPARDNLLINIHLPNYKNITLIDKTDNLHSISDEVLNTYGINSSNSQLPKNEDIYRDDFLLASNPLLSSDEIVIDIIPFCPSEDQDTKHWDRLFYLASIGSHSLLNPFNAQQEIMFQNQLAKKSRISYFVYGTAAVSIFTGGLGYFGFFGLLNPNLEYTLMPALLPTAIILTELLNIYSLGYEPHVAGVYDGLTLTLHELVLEELNFLAQFLIRKRFSKKPADVAKARKIASTMNLVSLRDAYARKGNAQLEEVSSLTRFLDEALIYINEDRIVDESFEVGEEIRVCILECQVSRILEYIDQEESRNKLLVKKDI